MLLKQLMIACCTRDPPSSCFFSSRPPSHLSTVVARIDHPPAGFHCVSVLQHLPSLRVESPTPTGFLAWLVAPSTHILTLRALYTLSLLSTHKHTPPRVGSIFAQSRAPTRLLLDVINNNELWALVWSLGRHDNGFRSSTLYKSLMKVTQISMC